MWAIWSVSIANFYPGEEIPLMTRSGFCALNYKKYTLIFADIFAEMF